MHDPLDRDRPATDLPPLRLTSLAHGGGCGCKLAPSVLQQLIGDQPQTQHFARLLVGAETGDDAAVWDLDGETCVLATTDFFMPVVDDPGDFGRIAATNALSDIYAMGGAPIMALAILGMPLGKVDIATVRAILQGGASICAQAGVPVAGGHSIDSVEPIYGLAVIGTARKAQIRRNADARPGDALILTKALGVGVYSAAFKKGALSAEAYDEMIASTTQLNRIGEALARDAAVHGVTDVTGFGLLGHALEMARGSVARLCLDADSLPLFRQAADLVRQGFVTGASERNWASYGASVELPAGFPDWRRQILTDPQTSGGLLVSCAEAEADRLVSEIFAAGYQATRRIGRVEPGEPGVKVQTESRSSTEAPRKAGLPV
jgi:selenide,water dikinase